MINTQLKFECKISHSSKVVALTRNYTKLLIFKANLTLKCQGQGHQFANTSEIFRWSINSLSVKAKFQIGQFKSLKQIHKFVGQFDLVGKGQGHQFKPVWDI